jgi:hypothetical protein
MLRTKHYDDLVMRVPKIIAGMLLVVIAVQVVIGGAQLEAAFEAGVIIGAGLLQR